MMIMNNASGKCAQKNWPWLTSEELYMYIRTDWRKPRHTQPWQLGMGFQAMLLLHVNQARWASW